MKRPVVSVRDPETNKRILREMNDDEFAQWEIDKIRAAEDEEKRKIEEQLRKDNAKKLVIKLAESVDLTEDEITKLLRLGSIDVRKIYKRI